MNLKNEKFGKQSLQLHDQLLESYWRTRSADVKVSHISSP